MSDDARGRFFAALGRPFTSEEIFDAIPDIVFFIKDRAGRYVAVNRTLVERSGATCPEELLGRTAQEVFPGAMGEGFSEQDAAVVRDGRGIEGQLELHQYPRGRPGWCLTTKSPVRDAGGVTIGLTGISRDLQPRPDRDSDLAAVAGVLARIRTGLDAPLPLATLAEDAGLSTYQLDQRIRVLFGISAGQYVIRTRIEAACHRLRQTSQAISAIALECGYSDQGAFTRQFRQTTGMTPRAYRERAGRD